MRTCTTSFIALHGMKSLLGICAAHRENCLRFTVIYSRCKCLNRMKKVEVLEHHLHHHYEMFESKCVVERLHLTEGNFNFYVKHTACRQCDEFSIAPQGTFGLLIGRSFVFIHSC